MFDFAEKTKEMSATEILNYYRNLYYTEPQVTERGIVANAINDILPRMVLMPADVVKVVRCKDCKHKNPCGSKCLRDNLWHSSDDFCSYGERKAYERT